MSLLFPAKAGHRATHQPPGFSPNCFRPNGESLLPPSFRLNARSSPSLGSAPITFALIRRTHRQTFPFVDAPQLDNNFPFHPPTSPG